MNIYQRKSYWKWYLAAGGALIVIITLAYTKFLADQLAERERQQAEQFAEAYRSLSKSNSDPSQQDCDMGLHLAIIQQNTTIPVVLLDEAWNIQEFRNLEGNPEEGLDIPVVRKALDKMIAVGADTIEISAPPYFRNYLIYSHSKLLNWLRWYPFVQLILVSAFVAFGYLGFSAARRAEENQVWLGMAKETAHQLGTPITAILGWLEALKATNEDNPDNMEMVRELGNDVSRLELVADRFSKIGAKPELEPVNIYAELEECREYMQRRAPRKVTFEFPDPTQAPETIVMVNAHLFDWVIENLLRNSIDAMEGGAGVISASVYREGPYVCLDISDTGKGIPSNRFKTVFKPGYSTKKRGWGLGLSLSKRIIEQYHGGKIFVKKSELNKGATFTVKLPSA